MFWSVLEFNGGKCNYNWDIRSRHFDRYVTNWAFIESTAVWAVHVLTLNCYKMDTTGDMTSFQATEGSPTGHSPPYLPQGVMSPSPACSPVLHANCVAMLFAEMLVVISYSSDKCFGLACVARGGWRTIQQAERGKPQDPPSLGLLSMALL